VFALVYAGASILAGIIVRVSNVSNVGVPRWITESVVVQLVIGLGPQVVGSGAMALAFIIAAVVFDRRQISDLGFQRDWPWLADFVFGCLLGLGLTTGMLAINVAAGWTTITGILTGDAGQSVSLYVIFFFIFYLCVGVREEVLFRDYLLTNIAEGVRGFESLNESSASWVAVLVTVLFFSLWHWGDPLTGLITAGLFGITYLTTDSLAIPIGLHTTWNLAILAFYGLPTVRTGGKLVETASNSVVIIRELLPPSSSNGS
jgi:membrane protease YdiL (CAAX protease family)